MAKITKKTTAHDLAEPQHDALMRIIHDGQGTAERGVDLSGGLIGNIGNSGHGIPPKKWVLGGDANIRTKDEKSKE